MGRCAIGNVRPDELIIIDDGSTDNSWEIIQDFARKYPFIRPFKNDKNMGCEFSVNRGLQLAQGDFFYGAAADDFVQPGFFEKSMALLSRYPEAGLCCTIGDWREESTGLNWHVGVGMTDEPAFLPPNRMVELERAGRLFIAGHTVIIKKSALFEVGKFNSEIKYACDWFSYTVTGFRYGICVVPEPLAVIQIQPNSYYQRGRRDKKGDLKVMEAIVRLLSQPQYQRIGRTHAAVGRALSLGLPDAALPGNPPRVSSLSNPGLPAQGQLVHHKSCSSSASLRRRSATCTSSWPVTAPNRRTPPAPLPRAACDTAPDGQTVLHPPYRRTRRRRGFPGSSAL